MTDLEELIQYWIDYRVEKGFSLGMDKWERVNDTILYLQELKALKEFGVKSVKED